MKKILLLLTLIIAGVSMVYAYMPTDKDSQLVDVVYKKVENSSKTENGANSIISSLEKLGRKYEGNERISYVISEVIGKIKKAQTPTEYLVIDVVDGDTIKVKANNKIQTIRILGIDTPEKYATRTGYEECYGKEASSFAEKTLSGQIVRIEFDPTQDQKDKYGRLLAHVFYSGSMYYEEESIKNGFGFRYVYKKPTIYDEKLVKAENEAKKNNVGVWNKCEGKRKPIDQVISQTKTNVDSILNSTGSAVQNNGITNNNSSSFSCLSKR